jgi:hypothetical protein
MLKRISNGEIMVLPFYVCDVKMVVLDAGRPPTSAVSLHGKGVEERFTACPIFTNTQFGLKPP